MTSEAAAALANFNYWFPLSWSVAFFFFLLSFYICYKSFALRKYLPRYLWLAFFTLSFFIAAAISTSYNLTLQGWREAVDDGRDIDMYRIFVRMVWPGLLVAANFAIHFIIRHKFKQFNKEPYRHWYDYL